MPVRFRFCGDDTVPDWVLVAINDLSSLDTKALKSLTQTVIATILNPDHIIDNDKKLILPEDLWNEKVLVAAIVFIMQSAIGYEVTEATLSNELQQIGFPHEHAIILCTIYTQNAAELKLKSKQLSLRCSILKALSCTNETEDFVLNLEAWQAESNSNEKYAITLTKEQAKLMVHGA